jgi:hypothetical protein
VIDELGAVTMKGQANKAALRPDLYQPGREYCFFSSDTLCINVSTLMFLLDCRIDPTTGYNLYVIVCPTLRNLYDCSVST